MEWHRKVALIVANEGFRGLLKRMKPADKAANDAPVAELPEFTPEQLEYARLVNEFTDKMREQGEDVSWYCWYHTVELGNGLATPGLYDYRDCLDIFRFPSDMSGMHVLDVGSATGFFSFEFEKRGADVVSVELPSLEEWDMPPGADAEQSLRELMHYHQVDSIERAYELHLKKPFEFCARKLNSNVRRVFSNVYDLTPEVLGRDSFDMVFLGNVLLHTFSPLKVLATVAPFCVDRLVVMEGLMDGNDLRPLMQYMGGERRGDSDNRTWWVPNEQCLQQMLKRVGFREVQKVGILTGNIRAVKDPYRQTIVHALK